jgi:hypothetical protein
VLSSFSNSGANTQLHTGLGVTSQELAHVQSSESGEDKKRVLGRRTMLTAPHTLLTADHLLKQDYGRSAHHRGALVCSEKSLSCGC